jgi:hypothetical protein
MSQLTFHTTIAWVPFHYAENDSTVLRLFSQHPEHWSVAIHGNNHDHYEFPEYSSRNETPWAPRSLKHQQADAAQSIARVEYFERVTDLSVDRVMVFPHNISPAPTFGILEDYGFLATTNAFEGFPSARRIPVAKADEARLAVETFLGNPLILFAHHDLFEEGIDAFNPTVRLLRRLAPEAQWVSLGDIVRGLYLQRRIDSSTIAVAAYSNALILRNPHCSSHNFLVFKADDGHPAVHLITAEGDSVQFSSSAQGISFSLTLKPGDSAFVEIERSLPAGIELPTVEGTSLRQVLLRRLATFRDRTVSRSSFGRWVTDVYYGTGLYRLGLRALLIFVIGIGFVFCGATVIGFRVWARRETRGDRQPREAP